METGTHARLTHAYARQFKYEVFIQVEVHSYFVLESSLCSRKTNSIVYEYQFSIGLGEGQACQLLLQIYNHNENDFKSK